MPAFLFGWVQAVGVADGAGAAEGQARKRKRRGRSSRRVLVPTAEEPAAPDDDAAWPGAADWRRCSPLAPDSAWPWPPPLVVGWYARQKNRQAKKADALGYHGRESCFARFAVSRELDRVFAEFVALQEARADPVDGEEGDDDEDVDNDDADADADTDADDDADDDEIAVEVVDGGLYLAPPVLCTTTHIAAAIAAGQDDDTDTDDDDEIVVKVVDGDDEDQ